MRFWVGWAGQLDHCLGVGWAFGPLYAIVTKKQQQKTTTIFCKKKTGFGVNQPTPKMSKTKCVL